MIHKGELLILYNSGNTKPIDLSANRVSMHVSLDISLIIGIKAVLNFCTYVVRVPDVRQ